MAWRPHGRAQVDPNNPQAFAVDDRSGFLVNHVDLQWQYQYRGNSLQNIRLLVTSQNYDVPHEFNRPIILGPDPLPIQDARPEPYSADFAATSPNINPGDLTQFAGDDE